MSRIRILPESVANKIAAGEVVERPASVVKELLENALDAGGKTVRIEVEQGGKRMIRVTDDGHGMTHDDALLAFERHATSKLKTADDLLSIATLGFRGEALPSIAAVSRLLLETRDESEPEGTRVEFAGGKLLGVKPAGLPAGTTVSEIGRGACRGKGENSGGAVSLKKKKGRPTFGHSGGEWIEGLERATHPVGAIRGALGAQRGHATYRLCDAAHIARAKDRSRGRGD